MMQKLQDHTLYYLSLIVILSLGFLFVYEVSPNRYLQFWGILATSIVYAVWGIIHHGRNHILVAKIVIEYILIGAMGISIALFVLKGGFGI